MQREYDRRLTFEISMQTKPGKIESQNYGARSKLVGVLRSTILLLKVAPKWLCSNKPHVSRGVDHKKRCADNGLVAPVRRAFNLALRDAFTPAYP